MSNDLQAAIEQVMREDASYNAAIEQVMREDGSRSKPGGGEQAHDADDDNGPIKGRVTNVRFLLPAENNEMEDGGSEHETPAPPLFNTKFALQTSEPHPILVAGSTTASDLTRKEVAVFGGTWRIDSYDNQNVLSDAAIMVIEPKKPAAVIFTRAGLAPGQIKKVIKHFGADKVIEILAEHPERIGEIKSIRPATAEKFVNAAQAHAEINLEMLAILTESGIAGHKALELVKRPFLCEATVNDLALKVFSLVWKHRRLRFHDTALIAEHPRVTACQSYHRNDAEWIIAFLVDVMTHMIEFGFEEYVYEGHCGYFLDEMPRKISAAMPPSLKTIFLRRWRESLPALVIEVGNRVWTALGEGVITALDTPPVSGQATARVKLDNKTEKILTRLSLKSPATVEINAAWEAAQNSPIWKEVFIEHEIDNSKVIYLRDEYENECEIARHLHRIFRGKKKPFEIPEQSKSLCEIDFDSDQNELLSLIHRHPIVLADGGPGAGKTTVVREVTLRAKSAQLVIQGMAFLGKAAARMRQHAGIAAHTIHRVAVMKSGLWADLMDNPVRPPDIVVIDEAAIISNEVFLMAVSRCPANARLVIIGDGGQLEPIGAGAPFLQMIKSGLFPVVKLRGQHRSGCGIVEACQAINRGEFPKDNNLFKFVERDDEEKLEYLEQALKNNDHNETQIVTTSNNERHTVNQWYRARKGYAVDQVYLDERVCGNRNVKETGAKNGEIGVVIGKSMTARLPIRENSCPKGKREFSRTASEVVGERQRPVFQVRFSNNPNLPYYRWPAPATRKDEKQKRHGPHPDIDWAYCLTGNKCQGFEWDNMIVHLTGKCLKGRPWATRKWLYTCVSRGRKTVVIYARNAWLLKLILANGADCFRITMLDKLLSKTFKKSNK